MSVRNQINEKNSDTKSGYLPSTDMFILLLVNEHKITHRPNMQQSKTSKEHVPELAVEYPVIINAPLRKNF